MFDYNYCFYDSGENTPTTGAGAGFNRLWFPHTPVVIEVAVAGDNASGTTTVKIQESDDNSAYTDVATITGSGGGKFRNRMLIKKAYVRANVTAVGSNIEHLTVGLVPAGEFDDPA